VLPTAKFRCRLESDIGVTSVNGLVSTWADQSGNGNDFVQATAAHQPLLNPGVINGLPVINFDGASQWLTSAFLNSGAKTVVAVYRNNPASSSAFYTLAAIKGSATFMEIYFTTLSGYNNLSFKADSAAGGASLTSSIAIDTVGGVQFHELDITYDGGTNTAVGSYAVNQDGNVQVVSTGGAYGFTGTNQCAIGADVSSGNVGSSFYSGDLAFFLVADQLTSMELAAVQQYLNLKYGV